MASSRSGKESSVFPLVLAFVCLAYGFFYSLTAPYLIVPLAVPIGILLLMSVWALPESATVPTRALQVCFAAMIIGLILWPNYLALSLPGLPWITMVRLTGFPTLFLLLVCVSASPMFRQQVLLSASSIPLLANFFTAFVAIQFLTLPLSGHISQSLNKVFIYQLNWTCVFVVSLYVCRVPGRAQRYLFMLGALAAVIMAVAFQESLEEKVLWAGHVPAFLRVEDQSAQQALIGSVRGATGQYRAKATASTALGLAELMALMAPFFLHGAVGRYPVLVRLACLVHLPVSFWVTRLTDARLGVAGYLVACMLYLLLWSLVRWRQRMSDLVAATVVYAYPAAAGAFAAATLFVHKIHVLVFGGGAQSASDEVRKAQFAIGIPKVLTHPLGHGAAQAGDAMGYGADQFVAIDSHYLSLALDYGFPGLIVWTSMFLMAIGYSVYYLLRSRESLDPEAHLLVPLASCIASFLVIKSVFEQPDNHPLLFMMLGMVAAIVTRMKAELDRSAARDNGVLRATPRTRRSDRR